MNRDEPMNPRQQRLFDMTSCQQDTGCWLWNGQVSNSGYGRVMLPLDNGGTKMVSAQTASYLAFIGPLPDGDLVKQRCGNRLCINPEHLERFTPG